MRRAKNLLISMFGFLIVWYGGVVEGIIRRIER